MKVFRIEREKYLNTTLWGIGSSMDDGNRWNSRFTRLVYTAESRALALLEVAVHLDLSEDLPSDRFLVEIDIPDDVKVQEIQLEELPADWNEHPPTSSTQAIGDDFVLQNAVLILKVPSCIVPDEFNYLINPHHEAMNRVQVSKKVAMRFDSRLGGLETQSQAVVRLTSMGKSVKKGRAKGRRPNFTQDDWKEECTEWNEVEWRAFRLKEDRERGPVHEVKGAARTAVKFSRAAALLAF